ncbi:hypothetical protein J4437_03040 [Candidatus Woesearchaeota archaeon]|nr:hypothetical protein [Candidatus Woesearchaeota archaeon]
MVEKIVKGVSDTVKVGTALVTNKLITYAFTAGVIIALVIGLASNYISEATGAVLTSLLILAGIVVGFFNISNHEAKDYVLFVTAIVIVTSLGGDILGGVQKIGPYLVKVLASLLAFIVPSLVVVGIKSILHLAKD